MAPTPSNDNETAQDAIKNAVSILDPSATKTQRHYREKAWALCADYLGGAWATIPLEEFRLKPFKGGLSSLLLLAELPHSRKTKDTKHAKVLVRLRQDKDAEYIHHESVIFTVLSERNLGPKLLGTFTGGRIEEYVSSRSLYCSELSLPSVARQAAALLLQVHCLDVPVSKKPDHLKFVKKWLRKLEDKVDTQEMDLYHTQSNVHPSEYPSIFTVKKLLRELKFLEDFMVKSRSPVVFCHNDFSPANTLLKDGNDPNSNLDPDNNPLMLIDFEFSDYNYRGFDLGQFFCSPGIDFAQTPYTFDVDKINDPHLRETFCNAYLDEAYKTRETSSSFPEHLVTGNRHVDMKQLLMESYCFTALSCFFFGTWAICTAYTREQQGDFNYHTYGRDRLTAYYKQRKYIAQFLEEL